FEGLSRYKDFKGLGPFKLGFLVNTDFHEKAWYPSGAVNRAKFSLDASNPVSGFVSQKMESPILVPCTAGISQDGIAVEKGKACPFSCYLRQVGIEKPVRVRLHHEGRLLASCEFQPGSDWKKFRAPLVPVETDTNATLTIEFNGPGTLWLDNASLMPEDNVGGWRADVVA